MIKKWWHKPSESYPEISKFDPKYKSYCGIKRLKVGDFIFSKQCWMHDTDYMNSSTYREKFKCDWVFLKRMIHRSMMGDFFIKKLFYCIIAVLFFITVSIFGLLFFKPVKGKLH